MKFESSLGTIWLNADPHFLTQISYTPIDEHPLANQTLLLQAQTQILEYLNGERKAFDLPYTFEYGTVFQQEVWHALAKIPYGSTCSYQAVAESIQRPKAVRALGQANRKNPLPILIPCHRVIGKGGQLVGYSGSSAEGLKIKQQLLALENPEFIIND